MMYSATLASSFEGSYEVYGGSDGTLILRDGRAWLIKETDAPLLGWEAHARKEDFLPAKESGFALVANSTKLLAEGKDPSTQNQTMESPLLLRIGIVYSLHSGKQKGLLPVPMRVMKPLTLPSKPMRPSPATNGWK